MSFGQLGQRGKQSPGIGVTGVVEYVVNTTDLYDLSCVKNSNTVSDVGYDTKVVGDEYDGVIELSLQLLEQIEDLSLNGNVKSRSRLVANKHLGLTGKSNSNNDSLSHTAGILEGIVVKTLLSVRNTNLLHHCDGSLSRLDLAAVLVLDNDRGNLLSDSDYRVKRGHRILEDGCNTVASNLSPVLAVLDFCEVQNASAVKAILGLVDVTNAEENGIEHLVKLVLVVEINADGHSSL